MSVPELRAALTAAKQDTELRGKLREAVIARFGDLIAAKSRSRKDTAA